jgi:hypothetical protein
MAGRQQVSGQQAVRQHAGGYQAGKRTAGRRWDRVGRWQQKRQLQMAGEGGRENATADADGDEGIPEGGRK